MRRSSGRPTKAASNNNNNNSTTTTTITTTSTRPTLSSRKRELSSTSRELLENSDTSKNKKKKQEVSIGSQIAVTAGIEVNDEEEEDEDEEEEEELGNQSTQLAKTIQSATPISVQRNVPAFLNKLYSMVDDPATDSLIRWSADGASFIVERHEHFAKTILPRFYKHNTFASFVRQLNMYDFHKIPTVQQGVLFPDTEREIWEFNHANFRRGRPDLLILVTRKKKDKEGANNGDGNDVAISLSSLVKQITSIRSHQQTITHDLHSLQRDNSILWQESLEAREKHQRHQEVIEKILQFLTAVFSSENNLLAATAAQMSGPFMLGKNNEYISLLNKEKQNILGQTPTGQLLDALLPTALIKQAASLVGLPKQEDPTTATPRSSSTSNTIEKGGNNDDNNNSMGSSMNDTASSSSSNAPSMMQMSQQEDTGFNHSDGGNHPDLYHQQESLMSTSPKTYHRDVETFKETLDTATRSAESITNDIDDLQFDIESLAANIGLDTAQFSESEFSGMSDHHFFSGNRTDFLTGASRDDKIQLYQLAGGSHITNKYDTSQPLKGKASVASVGPTPTTATTGGMPLLGTAAAASVLGGLVGTGTATVAPQPPMNLSTAPFIGGSQIPTTATTAPSTVPASSSTSSSLPPQLPLGTGHGVPGATTAHPSMAASAAASIAAQQLFNTGVSPLLTTLFQTFGPSITSNLNNNYAHPSSDFYHQRGGRFGAPQQQGSPSFPAATVPTGIPNMLSAEMMHPQVLQSLYQGIAAASSASGAHGLPGQQQFIPIPVPVPVPVPMNQPPIPPSVAVNNVSGSTTSTTTTAHSQFSSATNNNNINPFFVGGLYNPQQQQQQQQDNTTGTNKVTTTNNNNIPPTNQPPFPPTDPSL